MRRWKLLDFQLSVRNWSNPVNYFLHGRFIVDEDVYSSPSAENTDPKTMLRCRLPPRLTIDFPWGSFGDEILGPMPHRCIMFVRISIFVGYDPLFLPLVHSFSARSLPLLSGLLVCLWASQDTIYLPPACYGHLMG